MNFTVLSADEHQLLPFPCADRYKQSSPLAELVDERRRDRRSRGGDHDDVERSVLSPTDCAVAHHEGDVLDPKLIQCVPGPYREFSYAFDREHPVRGERKQGRKKAAPRPDFHHRVVGSDVEEGKIKRLEGGLGCGLSVSDWDGTVFVRSGPHPLREKEVPWNTIEELKDGQIVDSSFSNLLDELSPVPGETPIV
jgi:hypothetical protein